MLASRPFLDRHDIAVGEDWEARLGGLIQQADTVVFVVSPEAVKSERCAWEVNTALTKTKRLLPVIFKPAPESDIPTQLRRLQFVRFDTSVGITPPLTQLADGLRQNVDWIREHTRLGELAGRWEVRGRPESLLLRGDDLASAQLWTEQWNPGAPGITDLVRAFIAKSKEAEATYFANSKATHRRIVRAQAFLSLLLVAIIIGLLGWINQSYLKEQWRWYAITRPYMIAQVRPHVLTIAAEYALKPGNSFKECTKNCPEMVVVPAGSFTMGSPLDEPNRTVREGPQHVVTIAKPFAVSKYELTFADWDTCAAFGECDPNIVDSEFGRGRQPVINVSWYDAQQYVVWLSQMTGKQFPRRPQRGLERLSRISPLSPPRQR